MGSGARLERTAAAPGPGGRGGRPERSAGAPPLTPPTEAFRRIFGDNFFICFISSGPVPPTPRWPPIRGARCGGCSAGWECPSSDAAQPDAGARPRGFIERLPEPDRLPDWLSPADLDRYVAEFSRTGFTGALNWYRNFDRNWRIMGHAAARTIDVPALFVGGTADPVLGFTKTGRAAEVVTGPYRQVMLDGAGHWITQERPGRSTPSC